MPSDKITRREDEAGRRAPDLRIAGLKIWIDGRSHPEAMDYWDGNWLTIDASCSYSDSFVRSAGSIIHLREIKQLLQTCEALHPRTHGAAGLYCLEPELRVELISRPTGPIEVKIWITPHYRTQMHQFTDQISRRDLQAIKSACRNILKQYEIREDRNDPEVLVLNV